MNIDRAIAIEALRISQPIGEFYCGVINASDLVAISRADVRRMEDNDLDTYLGIQRPLTSSRVNKINRYIQHIDSTFPNSIIVSIKSEHISWDDQDRLLTIDPGEEKCEKIAVILDGQHRLAGFDDSNTEFLSADGISAPFQLLVTIFVEADISTQASIFATVNLAQTKVNKSLVYDLESLAHSRSPERTCHDIAVLLNSDEGGPFYRSIKRLGVATKGIKGEFLTQAAFIENLVKFISGNPAQDKNIILSEARGSIFKKGNKLQDLDEASLKRYFFRKAFIEDKDEIIAANVSNYFTAVNNRWPDAWGKNAVKSSLNKTIGFIALMRIFKDIYTALTNPPANWQRVISSSEFSQILSTSNVPSNFFIELDPTSKNASTIYREISESLSLPGQ
ncbi:MAG: DGQHR domain-containing protein [Reinekea sp.]